jgi:DNA-binding phage protein
MGQPQKDQETVPEFVLALSVRGNPRLSTLVVVTKAAGLRLTVEAVR